VRDRHLRHTHTHCFNEILMIPFSQFYDVNLVVYVSSEERRRQKFLNKNISCHETLIRCERDWGREREESVSVGTHLRLSEADIQTCGEARDGRRRESFPQNIY
jgi:hypothetical protein